jgi:plasmid replication initiation protein
MMLKKPVVIKATNLVEKRNILNEIKTTYFTLQEARIFAIYLSKINARDLSTRVVKFKLKDFLALIDIRKANIHKLMEATNKLLSIIVNVPDDNGGYAAYQLFKKCKVYKDAESSEWYVEIDAHDEALPLMFDFQSKYFTYQVGNVLRLNSSNQMRMYEILKQYEVAGSVVYSLDELKEFIGIPKNEYPRFNNFKQWVLDACQQALAEYTDICFTYEPYGKKGKGGKVLSLKFTITKNSNYIDQFTLNEFMERQSTEIGDVEYDEQELEEAESRFEGFGELKERFILLNESCEGEFTNEQLQCIYDVLLQTTEIDIVRDDIRLCDCLSAKYHDFKRVAAEKKAAGDPIVSRYGYFMRMLEKVSA